MVAGPQIIDMPDRMVDRLFSFLRWGKNFVGEEVTGLSLTKSLLGRDSRRDSQG
jgi:hypothetical protein